MAKKSVDLLIKSFLKNKNFRKDILKEEYITKTLPYDYDPEINKENRDWILKELLKICNMNQKHLEYYLSIIAYCSIIFSGYLPGNCY